MKRSTRLVVVAATVVTGLFVARPVGAQVPPLCSTGPTERLQWHVPRVEHHNVVGAFYGDNYCETTILVTNLDTRVMLAQVNFQAAGSNRCIQDQIGAGDSLAFATAPMTPLQNTFFPGAGWDAPGSVVGKADVHADSRDVHVSVHLVCRSAPISSPGSVVAMTPLPAIDRR